MAALRGSFARVDITPDRPAPLLGYFTERISTGVLDRLHCRIASLDDGETRLLFVQVDSCLITATDADRLKAEISRGTGVPPEAVMVFASHSHTAPALADFYAVRRDEAYLDSLVAGATRACATLGPGVPLAARVARTRAPGLASNRRWLLADGRVVTNPPRAHPALLRPEGPVDDEVNTILFSDRAGRPLAALASISNHTDTIGGTLVSADWPGVLEAEIRAAMGDGVVVVPFIGAAGNINHFDFLHARDQTSPAEAQRLGKAYAAAVLASLAAAAPLRATPLRAVSRRPRLRGFEVSAAEVARARELLALPEPPSRACELTAEDIFAGDPGVERIFAGRLLEVAAFGPAEHGVPLQHMRLGDAGFFAVPGEPFVEIGLALKGLAGFSLVVPVGLANGYFGYIPIAERYGTGGYEVKPGPAQLCRGSAERILSELASMAEEAR